MLSDGEKIGLIAGSGTFPINFAYAARQSGHPVTALAIEGFAPPELANHVDEIHWLGAGQLDTLIGLCHEKNISHLALAGKIEHLTIFNLGKIETRVARILARLTDRRAETIARALIEELESENIQIFDSSLFLKSFLPSRGLLTKNRPLQPRERRDIEFAWPLVREVARLDIGQTLVVKDGVILAVEGADGTDATIRRGGQIAGPGTVVVKTSRPHQDFRFDLPVVGLTTIATMAEVDATALAIAATETLFFDREQTIALAEKSNVSIMAWPDECSPPSAEGEKQP